MSQHRILFPSKNWESSAPARELCSHPYYSKVIPKTLYRSINKKLKAPNETIDAVLCKKILQATNRAIAEGAISLENDFLEDRIDFILQFDIPSKIAKFLEYQKAITRNYYDGEKDDMPTCQEKNREPFAFLYPDKNWSIKGVSKRLSSLEYFNPRISKELIRRIKAGVRSVPKPPETVITSVLHQYYCDSTAGKLLPRDPLDKRLRFLIQTFESKGHKSSARTISALDKMLRIVNNYNRN